MEITPMLNLFDDVPILKRPFVIVMLLLGMVFSKERLLKIKRSFKDTKEKWIG